MRRRLSGSCVRSINPERTSASTARLTAGAPRSTAFATFRSAGPAASLAAPEEAAEGAAALAPLSLDLLPADPETRARFALFGLTSMGQLATLPVALLGDSNRTRVGEFVLALGHPFGLEQTVSFGIVSRKGAPLDVATPGSDFIQTDATVNPGNSGGPLVNMAGEVVGVNSMAAVNGSIGFAIPVNLVKALLPQLAEKGKVEWGWLGVSIAEVTDEDLRKIVTAPEAGGGGFADQSNDHNHVAADSIWIEVQLLSPAALDRSELLGLHRDSQLGCPGRHLIHACPVANYASDERPLVHDPRNRIRRECVSSMICPDDAPTWIS